MLDAAVCGDVFASPSQIQIYHAIMETASKKGTLLIIKNYSGDVMNFKNAAHLLAEGDVDVDYVIVNDDIAVQDSLYTVGRRGVAGTILVHKIVGAAAACGWDLKEVKAAEEDAIRNVRRIGFAFSSCTVPAKGTPTFKMNDREREYGVGIHGEPGVGREKLLSADELAKRMISALVDDLAVRAEDEVTVLINGFGGTPLQELYVLNKAAFRELSKRNIRVYREFIGNYVTSIDMMGASISVMKMNPQIKKLMSAKCDTPAFHAAGETPMAQYEEAPGNDGNDTILSFDALVNGRFARIHNENLSIENMMYLIDRMGTFIIEQEAPFCELDSHAGDGDFGMSVAKGFKQLKREWQQIVCKGNNDIGEFLIACSLVIMEHCGGASGPIWGSAFHAAGRDAQGKTMLAVTDFAGMLTAALHGIQETGERSFGRGAVVGDKTFAKFDPTVIEGEQTDATELMYGQRHGTNSDRKMTLNLTPDIYELTETSPYKHSLPARPKSTYSHRGIKEYHYFVSKILYERDVKGKPEQVPVEVVISVKDNGENQYVYGISAKKIKASETQTLEQDAPSNLIATSASEEAVFMPPATENVSETDENVKLGDVKFSGSDVKPSLMAESTRKFITGGDTNAAKEHRNALHTDMVSRGAYYEITEKDRERLAKYFPDLRRMPKKERGETLKQAKAGLYDDIRQILREAFVDSGIELTFQAADEEIQVRVYENFVSHAVPYNRMNLTQKKAAALMNAKRIFDLAEYLYSSSHDIHSGASEAAKVDYWDHFYVPVKTGENKYGGIALAVRHVLLDAHNAEYQLYCWKYKNSDLLQSGASTESGFDAASSSVATDIISELAEKINPGDVKYSASALEGINDDSFVDTAMGLYKAGVSLIEIMATLK